MKKNNSATSIGNLRLFIEESPFAMAMFDNQMKYLSFSQRWLNEWVVGNKNILGKSHYEIFPEIDERWKKIHRHCLLGNIEKCDEDFLNRSDEKIQYTRWEVRPWKRDNNEIGGLIIFAEDITEKVKLQKELKLKEQYVLNLVHDLRTPLTIAKMSFELARKTSNERFFVKVSSAINRALNMITNILDANKLTAGHGPELNINTSDLKMTIDKTIQDFSIIHGNRFILSGPDMLMVEFSQDGMERVIENLLTNAIKYGYQDSPVTVSLSSDEHNALICVHNLGPPIEEEFRSDIFSEWFRLDHHKLHSISGWGLGLTLVKAIISAHHGEIKVESSAEKGTTFSVLIPLIFVPQDNSSLNH